MGVGMAKGINDDAAPVVTSNIRKPILTTQLRGKAKSKAGDAGKKK
jgi:hypothetical protein